MKTITSLHESLIDSYETEGYENRELSEREIAKMLRSHDADVSTLADTTNWTLFDMLAFLGY